MKSSSGNFEPNVSFLTQAQATCWDLFEDLPKFSNAHNSCGFSNPSKNGIRVIYHVLIFKVYDWFPVNDQATITWFSQQEQWGGVLHWVPLSETY